MAILKASDGLPLQTAQERKDIVWLDAACTDNIRIYGAAETRPQYRRLPTDLASQLRPELEDLSLHTSGIRAKNPDLPYIMVSKPDYRQHQSDRRAVIMESYRKALAAGDKNVYFIDGAAFFTGSEREGCTMDGTHPNDLGLFRMAQGMEHILRRILYGGGLY